MRRSGARTVWALILTIPALLAAIYLVLPQRDQAQAVASIQAAGQAVGQALGPIGLRAVMEVALVCFALASLALLLAPGYRQYRYLHLPTSVIPPNTVYVDAENINGQIIMDALLDHLRGEYLQGGRAKMQADLLFFMDALDTSAGYRSIPMRKIPIPKWKYEALYKSGFRLVNSPHIFTGVSEMAEAVDREIAMHALERALVGGAKQEFVIVSGDGDYVPLIYRLIALGHSVQVWMWGGTRAYIDAAKYLPITIYNLETGSYVEPDKTTPSEASAATPPNAPPATPPNAPPVAPPALAPAIEASALPRQAEHPHSPAPQNKRRYGARKSSAHAKQSPVPPPTSLTLESQKRVYFAIAETLSIRQQCAERFPSADDDARENAFNGAIGSVMTPRLESIGYAQNSRIEYWRLHLAAIGALSSVPGARFPEAGSVEPEQCARRLYTLVETVARAAARATPNRPDGLLNMSAILSTLADEEPTAEADPALDSLLGKQNGQRLTHARYLVYCARALGLVRFVEAPATPDLISDLQLETSMSVARRTEDTSDAPEATA